MFKTYDPTVALDNLVKSALDQLIEQPGSPAEQAEIKEDFKTKMEEAKAACHSYAERLVPVRTAQKELEQALTDSAWMLSKLKPAADMVNNAIRLHGSIQCNLEEIVSRDKAVAEHQHLMSIWRQLSELPLAMQQALQACKVDTKVLAGLGNEKSPYL